MRIVQFRKKQNGGNNSRKFSLGIKIPASNSHLDVTQGDIMEIPRSLLSLSDDCTSIDLIAHWDWAKETLGRYTIFYN